MSSAFAFLGVSNFLVSRSESNDLSSLFELERELREESLAFGLDLVSALRDLRNAVECFFYTADIFI